MKLIPAYDKARGAWPTQIRLVPKLHREPQRPTRNHNSMSANTLTETVQILLVDDDEDDFLLTRRLLRALDRHQFQLEWESDYHRALNLIQQDKHDIYLIDYNLGHWDGLELMEAAIASGCQKPMIVLTGQGEREIDLQAMARGAADYLVKGEFTPALFERSLRYAMERSRTLRALQQSELRYKELV